MIDFASKAWKVQSWILNNQFTPARRAACRIFSYSFVSKLSRISVEEIVVFKLLSLFNKTSLKVGWLSVSYVEETMPVRDPLKQAGHYAYAVPTQKLERTIPMVHCESWIERDYAYLLEYDPMVEWYEEQPCKISYIFDRKEHYYVPDFSVFWRNRRPSLVECKPVSKLDEPENLRKWTAARLWCTQNHYTFVVITDASLRELGNLLPNIKLLASHGHQRITPQAKEYLLRTVQAENRKLSVAELVERAKEQLAPNTVRSCVWHLLYTGELSADLSKPLNVMTTLVWFPTKRKEG
jgi:hypothetical protein